MPRPLIGNEPDMDQVRAWYWDEKKSLREISALTGVSNKTIWRRMDEAGIPRREPGPSGAPIGPETHVPPEEDAAIRAAIETGEKTEAIAARFGRSPATIARRCPPELSRKSTDRARAADREAKVRLAHGCGLRGAEIDRENDWPAGTASRIQQQLGLDPARPLPVTEAVSLYQELGSVSAAARELGRGTATIREALKAAGVTPVRNPRPSPRPPHPLDPCLDVIRHAYVEDNVPLPELAERYDVGLWVMKGFLERRGISRYRRLTAGEHDQLAALAARGMTKTQIAAAMDVSFPTVAYHLAGRPRPRLRLPAHPARGRARIAASPARTQPAPPGGPARWTRQPITQCSPRSTSLNQGRAGMTCPRESPVTCSPAGPKQSCGSSSKRTCTGTGWSLARSSLPAGQADDCERRPCRAQGARPGGQVHERVRVLRLAGRERCV